MLNYHTLEVGNFYADGGVMFGSVPKRYWSKKYPVNDENLCVLTMRCLLLETESRLILVDTGVGDKHFSKLKYYGFHQTKNIAEAIIEKGFHPDDVTDVILTHLHFDHCGGCTHIQPDDQIVPTFVNATYWVSKKNWENYCNPPSFEADSFFSENIEPVLAAGQLQLVEDEMVFTKNCRVKLFDGHTPGQIVVLFETETDALVFPADVAPTSLNLRLNWLSAYDNHAALAFEEKKRLFDICRTENRTFIFYHDAYTSSVKM